MAEGGEFATDGITQKAIDDAINETTPGVGAGSARRDDAGVGVGTGRQGAADEAPREERGAALFARDATIPGVDRDGAAKLAGRDGGGNAEPVGGKPPTGRPVQAPGFAFSSGD